MCIVLVHARLRMCWLGAHTHLGLLVSINCAGSHISVKWQYIYIHTYILIHFVNPKNLLNDSRICNKSQNTTHNTERVKIQSQKRINVQYK